MTAESCTGGGIAYAVTSVAGSSDWFERGYVTYSNASKQALLGVPAPTLRRHGAVSEPTARAMAQGALRRSGATIAVAVTGIAGPGGGSDEKPVGLVHLAAARRGHPTLHLRAVFPGDRTTVRLATVAAALDLVLKRIG